MEEKITVLRKAEGTVPMPTKIKIGDPSYFDSGVGLKHTYSKLFRGKNDWKGFLQVFENEIEYPVEENSNDTLKIKDANFLLYLGYDEKMLELLKDSKIYTRQKTKVTEIGVDTASYMLEVNKADVLIKTGGDGFIGHVCEYFTKNKLEAVVIDIIMSCDGYKNDFENNKNLMEALFGCKLEEVIV